MPEIEILYQDAELIVCVKPCGVASEQSPGRPLAQTMPGLLAARLGGNFYPVHRLDQPVGGVMVFARTQRAAAGLSAAFADKSGHIAHKEYLAVLSGVPTAAAASLQHFLYHDARANKTYAVNGLRKGVKEAVLQYRTLAVAPLGEVSPTPCALVAVRLLTGRTHQIRAQFAAEKLPLVGDGRYGSRIKAPDIALWAARLQFCHPVTGERMTFTVLPPAQGIWNAFAFARINF